MISRGRSGKYTTLGGVRHFIPTPLPPSPPLELSQDLQLALSQADRALARLDGATLILPNPELFVYAFMRQEAVSSSQIEGTQASLDDILEYEAAPDAIVRTADIAEVVNYLNAMDWGLRQLEHLPLSLRLIRGFHKHLLRDGRGSDRTPGEFRTTQNWIGPPGCRIEEATFVPPPPVAMLEALSDWENYLHKRPGYPPLIRCGLIHAQFETIHPFLDGNGRLGRMIITFMLCSERILQKPLLYLSLYLKQHRGEYYARLQAVRDDGDWEEWLLFFLRGVTATSAASLASAQKITKLRETVTSMAQSKIRGTKAPYLADQMFRNPYLSISRAAAIIEATYPTASSLIAQFEEHGILTKVRGEQRGRIYAFKPYLDVLHEGAGELTGIIEGEDYLTTNT